MSTDDSQNFTYDFRRARLLLKLSGEKRDVVQTCAAIRGKPSPCLDAILRSETLHPHDGVALRDAIAFTIRERRAVNPRFTLTGGQRSNATQPPSPPLLTEGAYTLKPTLVGHSAEYTSTWVSSVEQLLRRLVRAHHTVVDLPRADEWLKFPGHAVMDSRPQAHIVGIDYGLSDFGHVNPPEWPTRRLPPLTLVTRLELLREALDKSDGRQRFVRVHTTGSDVEEVRFMGKHAKGPVLNVGRPGDFDTLRQLLESDDTVTLV